ncbi:hypothetical protein [Candidatus Venteria ishoeyi]|uniref:Uncharacterized protein n=1 Tax=Candidatus Venteria ishoeyi TaxID=1899563 RepID=A0A1H6F957_9GAMM|nr:hypothetical protein [Candidatus Venteria ishoeyi]MDM8547974.1 hypothetical protein [Candidatus Venteria ishoeyi]SEH05931.1 Uncharacterised protein [Candidatus Venteria ishoeyi]
MKTPKLLKSVKRFLSADKNKQGAKIKCFKDILKKLKKKETALKNKLEQERDDKKRNELKKNIAVVHAQRYKGLEAIKKIKKNN